MDPRLARWLCIYCNSAMSSTKPNWMVLPCDHLICVACFIRYKETLKRSYQCFCGMRFDRSAYDILCETQQTAHDLENRNELDELD